MSRQHNCSECDHLRRTSPAQVFLRCEFWAAPERRDTWTYVPDEWEDTIQSYIMLHCHVQPEAPACLAFRRRRETVA